MSLTCKVNNIEIDLKYSDSIEENIISINSKRELFFDVYECIVNNKKIILEKVGESDLGPKVLLEVNIEGKKYSAEAILVDNGSTYVELNKENIYFIRTIPEENLPIEENNKEENIINNETSDNIEVNYENIIEHHINNKLVFLHELEEQFEEKIVSLKDDISNKLDLFFEKLEDKKKVIIEDKLEKITSELNEKFIVLQSELHGIEDFSKKNIDNILENKIKDIDKSVNLFLEGITKEYKNKIISSDKKITHNFLELNSIKDKLKENNNTTNKKFEELNLLKEKLLEQDELILKNQELKKFISEEFNVIDNKFKNLSEEENKKYNELLAAINNKDIVEYKTILKEKIQDVELTNIKEALQEDITNALQGDIVSLKRYVEMSSGGGSIAKQFARGGTMDGDLTVVGKLSAENYLGISSSSQDTNFLPLSGGTLTGLLSSNGRIEADTIFAHNILSATNLDIQFELSGFNVTGDILPSENNTFSIGSSAKRFKDIFLAGDTIDLSGTKISTDSDGDIEFRDSNNLTKRIKASEIVLESSNDPDNDIVFKVDPQGNPEFQKRRRSNPNIIEPSTTISDIVSAVQVRVRGNVGIGTSPIIPPNKPLTVVGDISATGNISAGSNLELGGNILDTAANELINIDANDITFVGKHIKSGFGVGIRGNRGDTKGIDNGSISANLAIYNNSIEAITVRNNGKVGIGVATPTEILTVAGNVSANGNLMTPSLSTNGIDAKFADNVTIAGDLDIGFPNENENQCITIHGSNSSGKRTVLSQVGNTFSISPQIGNQTLILGSISNNVTCICGNASHELRIPNKVTIGTTGGTEKLTVAGNISANGSLSATKIIGGLNNNNSGAGSFIGGGTSLSALGNCSVVTGGKQNIATLAYATVGGGIGNRATGFYGSTVGGGYFNFATGYSTTIAGGHSNRANGNVSNVGGGTGNYGIGNCSAVAGGTYNRAIGNQSFVGGGYTNKACGNNSSVVGGYKNCSLGLCSSILGGANNCINTGHNCSFIIGTGITSSAACTTFVNNLTSLGTLDGCSIESKNGFKIGEDAIVTYDTSFTLPLSDNGRTTLLDTTSGSIVVTVPNLETGFSNRFIKEAGAAPVVFSVGNGLSALGSYQDRNQLNIIYAQADIFYKNENYAFLGGNLE